MILSGVAKLQSPGSKFRIEIPLSTTVDSDTCNKRKTADKTSSEIGTSKTQCTFVPKTLFSLIQPDETTSTQNANSAYDIVLQDKVELEKKHALLNC